MGGEQVVEELVQGKRKKRKAKRGKSICPEADSEGLRADGG